MSGIIKTRMMSETKRQIGDGLIGNRRVNIRERKRILTNITYRNSSNLTRPLINANWPFWVKSCNLFPLIISATCNFTIII